MYATLSFVIQRFTQSVFAQRVAGGRVADLRIPWTCVQRRIFKREVERTGKKGGIKVKYTQAKSPSQVVWLSPKESTTMTKIFGDWYNNIEPNAQNAWDKTSTHVQHNTFKDLVKTLKSVQTVKRAIYTHVAGYTGRRKQLFMEREKKEVETHYYRKVKTSLSQLDKSNYNRKLYPLLEPLFILPEKYFGMMTTTEGNGIQIQEYGDVQEELNIWKNFGMSEDDYTLAAKSIVSWSRKVNDKMADSADGVYEVPNVAIMTDDNFWANLGTLPASEDSEEETDT
jgi:hypothetical protein